jgi:serine/threonine protein kinase
MEQALNPASLPAGTRVGPWRLSHLLGRGAFGTVYRAEGVARGAKGPAALKLAHAPHDERFAREVALLSRLRHPCIPRFLGHGHWQSPLGLLHPFVAMELVEGLPLYEWARASNPSSRQVLRLFAGLARALESVHAAGGVHRDVKGGNVLVRRKDGRGFLVDFGSCSYEGASPLTWHPLPPGTLSYRAPEALAHSHHLHQTRGPLTPYSPKATDDLFALGVTAWRLVVGTYPATYPPLESKAHAGAILDEPGPRPAHELNTHCGEELSALISQMLSVRPEARGTARELAQALEHAARRAGKAADIPLFRQEAPQAGARPGSHPPPGSHGEHRWGGSPLTAVSLSTALAFAVVWVANRYGGEVFPLEQASRDSEERDGGTVGLGDTALTEPVATRQETSTWSPMGLDLPSKPLPGQRRPDAYGRCSKHQVPINGGCWKKQIEPADDCDEDSYVYKGACYLPVYTPPRPPTSNPTDAADGGAR